MLDTGQIGEPVLDSQPLKLIASSKEMYCLSSQKVSADISALFGNFSEYSITTLTKAGLDYANLTHSSLSESHYGLLILWKCKYGFHVRT